MKKIIMSESEREEEEEGNGRRDYTDYTDRQRERPPLLNNKKATRRTDAKMQN